ncbi:Pectinesterase inhibitor [Artemisia annua]|uniref:Pectinesterase inhibitor n=1 Tax=Artemisia annua TaxID=35608 RepID=A0A2U1L604_ARTAN|nr:Pectinesterase inhibitor [Artemisia annua]
MKLLLTIFFLLVVQETLFSATADRKFIENTCKGTPNYDLCLSIILADPKSEDADLTGLALIAVTRVEQEGEVTITQINALKSSRPELRPALDYCAQVYNAVVKGRSVLELLCGGIAWFDLIFWKMKLLMDEAVKECLEKYGSYFMGTDSVVVHDLDWFVFKD